MNETMPTWDTVQQNIRILLYAVAGSLVMKGYMAETLIEPLVGLGMFAVTWLWWKIWNRTRPAPSA